VDYLQKGICNQQVAGSTPAAGTISILGSHILDTVAAVRLSRLSQHRHVCASSISPGCPGASFAARHTSWGSRRCCL